MSSGRLLVFRPGKTLPTEVMWQDFDRNEKEPGPNTVKWIVGGPIGRATLTYAGKKRFVYYPEDFDRGILPINEEASKICGFPMFGVFVINILKE